MIKEVIAKNEERMKKTLSAAKSEFASLRAGRATPALLDKVMVEYYGSLVPVNHHAANIHINHKNVCVLLFPYFYLQQAILSDRAVPTDTAQSIPAAIHK